MRYMRALPLILCAVLLAGLLGSTPPVVQAACPDIVVGNTGNVLGGDCTMAGTVTIDANTTIDGNGYAITALTGNRHFIVAPGMTLTLNNVTLTGAYSGGNGGSIYNNGGTVNATDTIFSGNAANTHGGTIYTVNGTVTLVGGSFVGNDAGGNGGAIYNRDSTTSATGTTFTDNDAGANGGAILNFGAGVVIVTNSTFSLNDAGMHGGAIRNTTGGTLTVTGGSFTSNTAQQDGGAIDDAYNMTVSGATFTSNTAGINGGAIQHFNGYQATITGSTFTGNTATNNGGALINVTPGSLVTVTGCTFTGNQAVDGAGIRNTTDTTMNIANSTLSGNIASSNGGGIDNAGIMTVTNSTLSNNSAVVNGGGIRNFLNGDLTASHLTLSGNSAGSGGGMATIDSTSVASMVSSIVSGSTGADCLVAGPLTPVGANISGDASCGFSLPSIDPVLGPLAANGGTTNTMALLDGSPAIDSATSCTITTDQRGITRPQGAGCDLGAYEGQSSVVVESGSPVQCSAIQFLGGWGIFAEGSSAENEFTLPDPPAGYGYLAQPAYTGYCDVFTVGDDHSALPVEVCWTTNADAVVGLYHDQPDLSRTWSILPTVSQGNSVCASLPQLGAVTLLSGGVSAAVTVPVGDAAGAVIVSTPVNCQVTTTHRINFRETPGGTVSTRVPYETTLSAFAEANGWYEVEWLGQPGWISADYVTALCE